MNENNKFVRLLKELYPNTLIKKIVYVICIVTILLLLLTSNLVSVWTYRLLKPELQHNLSVLTGAVATKTSYILHQNTQYLLKLMNNETLLSDAVQYLDSAGSEAQNVGREQIISGLTEEKMGEGQPGAICSTRNAILIVDWKYAFSKDSLVGCSELIFKSPWYSKLSDDMQQTGGYEENGRRKRIYSPVFSSDSVLDTEEFISMAMLNCTQGHDFLFILIEPFDDFRQLFQDFLDADISDFCLIGNEEKILFQNQEESYFGQMESGMLNTLFVDDQYAVNLLETNGHTVIGTRISYQAEQLKLFISLPNKKLLQPYRTFSRLIMIILFVFSIFLIGAVIAILNHSLNNLRKLSVQMQNVRGGMMCVSKNISGRDEIGMLADTFYEMMDQIEANIKKIKEQEQKEKRVEYSLLLSQIDPHFIYNTLNTITYLAELNRPKDITIINESLTSMLRDRLKMTKLQIYDSLDNEKKQLLSYITIQQYLCNSELSLEFHISSECENILYPKNVLQPLVENSILHGILLHRDENNVLFPGHIEICIYSDRDKIITKIRDNGIGMDQEQIKEYFGDIPAGTQEQHSDTQQHIGIYNIRMRLDYLYGEMFCIWAVPCPDCGLEIILEFPPQIPVL
ncbi:MAG: histidine kinase [Eubacteriales bacterium]|nr:histidine kinase [Eubacteriales bacterium]